MAYQNLTNSRIALFVSPSHSRHHKEYCFSININPLMLAPKFSLMPPVVPVSARGKPSRCQRYSTAKLPRSRRI